MSDKKPEHTSRRKFFGYAAAGATAAGGFIVNRIFPDFISNTAWEAAKKYAEKLLHHVDPSPESYAAVKNLLLNAGAAFDVLPSSRLNDGVLQISEPTQVACHFVDRIITEAGGEILDVGKFETLSYERNLLLLGGPVANPLTKQLMGNNGKSEIFLDGNGSHIKFPFYFNLVESEFNKYKSEKQHNPPTQDWNLHDQFGKIRNIDLDDQGRPKEDHVLITSIPNILNEAASKRGDRIVIFAGRHGVATRSLGLFAGSNKIAQQLNEITRPGKGWQAIVRISEVQDGVSPLKLDDKFVCIEMNTDFSRALVQNQI